MADLAVQDVAVEEEEWSEHAAMNFRTMYVYQMYTKIQMYTKMRCNEIY